MVQVSIISDLLNFQNLRTSWNSLLRQSSSNTIFLTWEWAISWWQSYCSGKSLWILAVKKDDELIGIAPFYRSSLRRYGLNYAMIHFIGDGSSDSDYMDIIVKAGYEGLVIREILKFMPQYLTSWDILHLNEIPQDSPNIPILKRDLAISGWLSDISVSPCCHVPLPTSWQEYLSLLKPRMRTKLRSLSQRVESTFKVEFSRCTVHRELAPRLESLFLLHNSRWAGKSIRGIFESPAKRQFYYEISKLFLEAGWLSFHSLFLDNMPVAHQFCFEYDKKMFLLQEGFDLRFSEYGVGNVLRAYVFRHCIETGISSYDFLAGITTHKESWGAKTKYSIRLAIAQPSLKSRIYFAVPETMEKGKSIAKRILPPKSIAFIKRLQLQSKVLHHSE
jgi:CelD/BcsL family acetyltransferase involved in cellulose biosynthesis